MPELPVKGVRLPSLSRSENSSKVIDKGQFVIDSDTNDLYLGDGITTYGSLTAINGGGGGDYQEQIDKINSVDVGSENSNSGTNAIAIGFGTTANYNYSVAIGNASVAGSQYAVALGPYAYATGSYAIKIGYGSTSGTSNKNATGRYSIAIGYHAGATASNAIAIGNGALATGADDICLGTSTKGASNKGIYLNEGLITETDEIPEPMGVEKIDEICYEILGV